MGRRRCRRRTEFEGRWLRSNSYFPYLQIPDASNIQAARLIPWAVAVSFLNISCFDSLSLSLFLFFSFFFIPPDLSVSVKRFYRLHVTRNVSNDCFPISTEFCIILTNFSPYDITNRERFLFIYKNICIYIKYKILSISKIIVFIINK